MTYLRTQLKDIEHDEVFDAIFDICEMLGWPSDNFTSHTLFDFFQISMTRPASELSMKYIAVPRILAAKMESIQAHQFYCVCLELNDNNSLEPFDRVNGLSFLKKRFAGHRPQKRRKPTTSERWDAVYRQRNQNRQ